eukprot:COSAG05_NODE_29_length_29038_cov_1237.466985_5_plen_52_part_00
MVKDWHNTSINGLKQFPIHCLMFVYRKLRQGSDFKAGLVQPVEVCAVGRTR